MIERVFQRRTLAAMLIFNLEDSYLRARLGSRTHPRPYEPLRFWLVARLAPGPREDYAPPRELVVMRNPSGYHLFFGEEWLSGAMGDRTGGPTRPKRRLDLIPGQYRIRVTSPLYQDAERSVMLPMPNLNLVDPGSPDPAQRDPLAQYSLDLWPSHVYPFPDGYPLRVADPDDCPDAPPGRRGPTLLYGSLYTTDGQGVEGVRVLVANQSDSYVVGKNGQWVLWFRESQATASPPPPIGPVTVRFTLPGNPPLDVDVADVCVVRGCTTSLGQAALRGWVMRQGMGVGGAAVAISGQPSTVTTRPDGAWTYYFDLNQPAPDTLVSVTATLPDGASQTLDGVEVRRRATVMARTFIFP